MEKKVFLSKNVLLQLIEIHCFGVHLHKRCTTILEDKFDNEVLLLIICSLEIGILDFEVMLCFQTSFSGFAGIVFSVDLS